MQNHSENYYSTHSPIQLFNIVANVQEYPEFIPWITGCRIHEKSDNEQIAELLIKFKSFRSSYISRVKLSPPQDKMSEGVIDVSLVRGPFKSLTNHWHFKPAENGGTNINFNLEFEFTSKILSKLLNSIFAHSAKTMVSAFEKRADELYG